MHTTHEGAVYLHGGRQFEVAELDLDARRVLVQPFQGNWYTQPKKETDTYIEALLDRREYMGVTLSFGNVTVTEQVLAYQRKRMADHEAIDLIGLDLPQTSFTTQALWYELPPELLRDDFPLARPARRAARRRALADRGAAAAGDVRPLGHRRASRPTCTRRPAARRSSSTTATPAGSASPAAATSPSTRSSTTPTG